MKLGRGGRFVLLGVAVSVASLGVQQIALRAGLGAKPSAYLRLAFCVAPIYLGYSRWVLRELWVDELLAIGRRRTEVRMLGRVASSVGASIVLKTLLEPTLTAWMLARWGTSGAGLAAILGDYTYGPLATYLVLAAFSRREGASS